MCKEKPKQSSIVLYCMMKNNILCMRVCLCLMCAEEIGHIKKKKRNGKIVRNRGERERERDQ